jgi:hypothetical protein
MTAKSDHQRRKGRAGFGEQLEVIADQAVATHLEQHRGQDHRAGGGRFDVRIRQPGVEGEDRHFDRKGDGKGQEEQRVRRERAVILARSPPDQTCPR